MVEAAAGSLAAILDMRQYVIEGGCSPEFSGVPIPATPHLQLTARLLFYEKKNLSKVSIISAFKKIYNS